MTEVTLYKNIMDQYCFTELIGCKYLSIGKPSKEIMEEIINIHYQEALKNSIKEFSGTIASFNDIESEFRLKLNNSINIFNRNKTYKSYIWLEDLHDLTIMNGELLLPKNDYNNIQIYEKSFDNIKSTLSKIKHGSLIFIELLVIDKTRPNIIIK